MSVERYYWDHNSELNVFSVHDSKNKDVIVADFYYGPEIGHTYDDSKSMATRLVRVLNRRNKDREEDLRRYILGSIKEIDLDIGECPDETHRIILSSRRNTYQDVLEKMGVA